LKNAVEFIKKASEDSALKATLKSAIETAGTRDGEIQAAVKVAKDAGFDISADEMKALVLGVKRQSGELSEDELEQVAGGGVAQDVGAGLDSACNDTINGMMDGANAMSDGINAAADAVESAANDVASFFSGW
jgi:predicted ribosomally synthesized peptide with nif11-like leader